MTSGGAAAPTDNCEVLSPVSRRKRRRLSRNNFDLEEEEEDKRTRPKRKQNVGSLISGEGNNEENEYDSSQEEVATFSGVSIARTDFSDYEGGLAAAVLAAQQQQQQEAAAANALLQGGDEGTTAGQGKHRTLHSCL